MAISLQNLKPQWFWKNPVVVRDMRVRLRGTRAFWNQAFYLGLLCIIALLGYGASVQFSGGEGLDPVFVQRSLQQFYNYIFIALALLISLIAPALTAVSIISERQRLTLDLLVTTPMTSMQMLTGKLISTIAFILLLLVLSLPVSSLCVILGGATVGDLLQTYALLAIDGIVLAAVGLGYSCTARQNVQAIVGTYAALLLFLFITGTAGTSLLRAFLGSPGTLSSAPQPLIAAVLDLNPFVAIYAPGHTVSVFGLGVPVWIATGVAAFLIVRLMLTGAALRLGLYGAGLVGSLRRQALLCVGAAAFLLAQSVFQLGGVTADTAQEIFFGLCAGALVVTSFALPALFVPVVDESAPQGVEVKGVYDPRRMFSAAHSGSLPYFHLLLVVIVGCILLGATTAPVLSAITSSGPTSITVVGVPSAAPAIIPLRSLAESAGSALFYLSGLGYLMWSLARRGAWLSPGAVMARPLSFLMFLFLFFLPLGILLIQSQAGPSTLDPFVTSPVRLFWLGYPMIFWPDTITTGLVREHALWTGALAYFCGVLIYPPWRGVVPGAGAFLKPRPRRAVLPPAPPPAPATPAP